jgi:fibronectin-binding autotransporter adhesin
VKDLASCRKLKTKPFCKPSALCVGFFVYNPKTRRGVRVMKTKTITLLTLGGLMVLLVTMALAPPAMAMTVNWDGECGANTDWSCANNWSPNYLPSVIGGDNAFIKNNATVTITQPGAGAGVISLGGDTTGGRGTLNITGGSLTTLNTNSGSYGYLYVGGYAPSQVGVVNQSGGTAIIGILHMGYESGSSSTYNLTGGTLEIHNQMFKGMYGTAALNMSGNSTLKFYNKWSNHWDTATKINFSATGGTVEFANSNLLNVTTGGDAFYNLQLSGSGTYSLQDNVTAQGNLTLQNGTVSANSKTINLYGNYSQTGGALNSANIVLQGGGNQAISRTAGTMSSTPWTVSKTANTMAYQTSALSLPSSLTINSGIWNTNGNALTISGAFANNSVFRTNGNEALNFTKDTDSGLVEYMGHAGSTMNYGNTYYDLRIATTAGSADLKPSVSSDLIVNRNLEVVRGTLDTNGKNVSIGGALSVSIGTLKDTAGSTVTLGGASHTVTGGTLQVDGTLNGVGKSLAVSGTGVLSGSGIVNVPVTVLNGGTISPGNSPGILTFNQNLILGPDSVLNFEINDVAGTRGVNWDGLNFASGITVDMTTATVEDPILIKIYGKDSLGNPGDPTGFDPNQAYSWMFWDIPKAKIIGYDPAKFAFEISGFGSATGTFGTKLGSNQITYGPKNVPEIPAGLLIPLLGLIGGAMIWLRKKATK